jgi:hypothetical protein
MYWFKFFPLFPNKIRQRVNISCSIKIMANRNLVSYSFLTVLSKDDFIILQAKHNSPHHLNFIYNIHMCCTLLYLLDYLEYPPQFFSFIKRRVLCNTSKKDYWTSKKKVAPQSVTKIKAVIVMFYSHFVAILKSDSVHSINWSLTCHGQKTITTKATVAPW